MRKQSLPDNVSNFLMTVKELHNSFIDMMCFIIGISTGTWSRLD